MQIRGGPMISWSRIVVSVVALSACSDSSDTGGSLPDAKEVSYFLDDERGPALSHDWTDATVKPATHGCAATVGTSDRAVMKLGVVETKKQGGGLLRTVTLERFRPGTKDAVASVPLDLSTVCAADGCSGDLYPECEAPVALADEGMLVPTKILPWGPSPGSSWFYLLRFDRDGQLSWSKKLPEGGAVAAQLANGNLAVASRLQAPRDTSAAAQNGFVIQTWSATGDVLTTTPLADLRLADSGKGMPAVGTPFIQRIQPLRDGGFAVAGYRQFVRDIACGTLADPQPPTALACAQYVAHGLVGRYGASGQEQWIRELGNDFAGGGSNLNGLVELEDGELAATGLMSKGKALGGGVIRVSGAGEVRSRLLVCPCRENLELAQGFAGFSEPIARANGAIDVVASPIDGPEHRLLRVSASGELLGVRRYRSPAGEIARSARRPASSSTHWYIFEEAAETQLRSVRLAP
jgi:hypothetical protein